MTLTNFDKTALSVYTRPRAGPCRRGGAALARADGRGGAVGDLLGEEALEHAERARFTAVVELENLVHQEGLWPVRAQSFFSVEGVI